ncbi:hypothetical protein [uncultured Erythrobacter sp.]|uniref:hypothetical protein n=1 Tax=uncultured Erythrobacter sp. TaxID=263913 RepID=UPI00261C73D9|nr:hypothetical protein [uncultured Erythrobacter sp.]
MSAESPTRFLLYIDILGFKDMTLNDPRKVARVYSILDRLNVHDHPNFKTIVFSDTILTYNPELVESKEDREYIVWYLTEFAEDLYSRLVGQDIYFRAILVGGDFHHFQLDNVECFFGGALIRAYLAEQGLPFFGLLMHQDCVPYNRFFRLDQFDDEYSFVYLSRPIEQLHELGAKSYPVSYHEVADMAPNMPESIRFLQDTYKMMRNNKEPTVRAKALTVWDFYSRRYPKIIAALTNNNFSLDSLGPRSAWADEQAALEKSIKYYKRIGSGSEVSIAVQKFSKTKKWKK